MSQNRKNSSEGNVFFLGTDVILEAGAEAIREMQSSERINTVHFDFKSLREHRNEQMVQEFLRAGEEQSRNQNLNVIPYPPTENKSEVEVVSDDYYFRTAMRSEEGFNNIERPEFLIENPESLKDGIIKTKTKDQFKSLKETYDLEDAIDRFSLNPKNMFPNQFFIVRTPENLEGLYQMKLPYENMGPQRDPKILGEPYLQRLEEKTQFFSGNKNPFENVELDFGMFPNHLNQHLAYHYLLLDPSIELVTLSGEAGSGKTLLAYMAALKQTLIETDSISDIRKGDAKSLYQAIRLVKASLGEEEYKMGFLPGDVDDKQGPLMKSFAHIHDYELRPIKFDYTKAKEKQSFNWYLSQFGGKGNTGLYAPREDVPLIFEEPIEYVKGMTFNDSFIVVDEVEDARPRVAKSLLTRGGRNSKTVLCGDPYQITTRGLSPDKNGLVYSTVGHMRMGHPFFGMMHLPVSSRGNIARRSNNLPDRKS